MSKLSVFLTTLLLTIFTTTHASTIIGIADNAFVLKNNTLIFDVLENDKIDGEILGFGIEIYPSYGEVIVNEDLTVTYIPNENVCEESDYFYYYVEDAEGPKLVEVNVDIICEPITVINGFYGDSSEVEPPSFTILGAENYPDNSLYVFSDDGEEVFYSEGYMNEWNGQNSDSENIEEDRIYYYVFNDGLGGTYSGYLQMN